MKGAWYSSVPSTGSGALLCKQPVGGSLDRYPDIYGIRALNSCRARHEHLFYFILFQSCGSLASVYLANDESFTQTRQFRRKWCLRSPDAGNCLDTTDQHAHSRSIPGGPILAAASAGEMDGMRA